MYQSGFFIPYFALTPCGICELMGFANFRFFQATRLQDFTTLRLSIIFALWILPFAGNILFRLLPPFRKSPLSGITLFPGIFALRKFSPLRTSWKHKSKRQNKDLIWTVFLTFSVIWFFGNSLLYPASGNIFYPRLEKLCNIFFHRTDSSDSEIFHKNICYIGW